jgi:hypothetical protein
MFHTGIVLRRSVDQPEDVASYRMRAFHLEEIAQLVKPCSIFGPCDVTIVEFSTNRVNM